MGLERRASCLQGVLSNFEIDILKPMCIAAGDALGFKYSYDAAWDAHVDASPIICEPARSQFTKSVNPGPDKANYIVRLLLRRAAMEGYLLGKKVPFLHTLVPAVVAGHETCLPGNC